MKDMKQETGTEKKEDRRVRPNQKAAQSRAD